MPLARISILGAAALVFGHGVWAAGGSSQGSSSQGGSSQGGNSPSGPAATLGESIEVESVSVDVWVHGAGGAPVSGLTAADFEVLHDGKPVALTHFAEVRAGIEVTPRAETGHSSPSPDDPPTPGAPSSVVVYFDASRIHPLHLRRAVTGVAQLIEASGVAAEQILLLRQDGQVSIAAGFGSSRAQLLAALDQLAAAPGANAGLDTAEAQGIETLQSIWERSRDVVGSAATGLATVPGGAGSGGVSPRGAVGGPGSGPTGAGESACGPFLGQIRPTIDWLARSQGQRVIESVAHLSRTLGLLAGIPGVKSLFYVSDGLDTRPGSALVAYAAALCPGATSDLLSTSVSEAVANQVLAVTRLANSLRVTFYSIQASGLEGTSSGDAAATRRPRGAENGRAAGHYESSRRASERDGLRALADQTGGRVIFDRNELGPALATIAQELRSYYSLAYSPPRVGGVAPQVGRQHDIDVRLHNRSYQARFRRGYVERDPSRWLADRIEGALNLGITDNPLEVRLGSGRETATAADGVIRVPLYVLIPVERIAYLPQGDSSRAELRVEVLARRGSDNFLVTNELTVELQQTPGAEGFIKLTVPLDLQVGEYLTAVGVVNTATHEASFVSTLLPVTAPSERSPDPE